MAKGFSLADQLINPETIGVLASGFAGIFDHKQFHRDAIQAVGDLALKERLHVIAAVLTAYLADDFPTAAAQIKQGLPPPLDPARSDDDFGMFIYAPLGIYVENHAVEGHFSLGLDTIEEITKRFSMEFSLRAFLNHDQEQTMARVQQWARHENYHVRRLASEGTRPRLPWGQNVGLTHDDTVPVLDVLHNDHCRFVTRSVANHLNDIAKIAPDVVVDRLDQWVNAGKQTPKELLWMRKHALRGLIKQGHQGAMAHLGYDHNVDLEAARIDIPERIMMGEKVDIISVVRSKRDAPLIVDYVVEFLRANGSYSTKVFKLKMLNAKTHVDIEMKKRHYFDDTATTFKLYSGAQRIHLQVNGRRVASADFTLC